MINDEKILLKVLEHGNTSKADACSSICTVLNLQYFMEDGEPPVHTLASLSFVIDICGLDLKLIFVDEELTRYFRYVEFYLHRFSREGDLVSFYYHLKMFVMMEVGNEQFREWGNADVCKCVFSDSYCINPSFSSVKDQTGDGIYNIFRHRFEYHFYTKSFLVPVPAGSSHNIGLPTEKDKCRVEARTACGATTSVGIGLNLAEYFDVRTMSRDVLKELPDLGFHWRKQVNGNEIVVTSDMSIYLDKEVLRDASFLMKLGTSLEFSLMFFNYI